MFSRGTAELIDGLPRLEGLDGAWARRRLSEAYLEVLAARQVVERDGAVDLGPDVRRLVDALEIYVLQTDDGDEHVPACAFVAAEALELWLNWQPPEDPEPLQIEAALMFMVAGFDANAAAASPRPQREPATRSAWAKAEVVRLLRQARPSDLDPPDVSDDSRWSRIAGDMWLWIGQATRAHHRWIRGSGGEATSPGVSALTELERLIRDVPFAGVRYSEIAHLTALLRRAMVASEARALRVVSAFPSMADYVATTAPRRPLMWKGAERFARGCLEELSTHCAVAVPTGSGKSAIAELAVVRALAEGWAIYLAPTNALVAQIRRDLRPVTEQVGGELRAFLGAGEYSDDEVIEDINIGDLFVMTPEKCALVLRQSPEAFSSLRLVVADECHLIGTGGTRGVVLELVLAEILTRSLEAAALLMSALVSDASGIADWLRNATGRDAVAIQDPWRPTRTLRGIVGVSSESFAAARAASGPELAARPKRVSRHPVALSTMVGLQGAWRRPQLIEDYAVAGLPATVEAQFRSNGGEDVETWRNRAAESLSIALVRQGERVLTFTPSSKHEVITVGRAVAEQFPVRDVSDQVEHLIALAEYELNRPSEVGVLLRSGVATHSRALLETERRASELAFRGRDAVAPIMIATTSLAQGLNLPATVVVIAGTQIGGQQQEAVRTARDLLNAIGRAGRPFVANRSLALVIPSTCLFFGTDEAPHLVAREARFVESEDATGPLESQLLTLLRTDPARLSSLEGMTDEELAAFTYLPLNDTELPAQIIRRSLGYHQRSIELGPDPEHTVDALRGLGERFLAEASAPRWLVRCSYLAGVDLRAMTGLYLAVLERPSEAHTVDEWAQELVTWLEGMEYVSRDLLCSLRDVPEPLKAGLQRGEAGSWNQLRACVAEYLAGTSLSDLAATAFGLTREDGRRSSADPLPKAIGLTQDLLSYRLSVAAGAANALFTVARGEEDSPDPLGISIVGFRSLQRLPLALRLGCADDDARQWAMFGVRDRRLAHLLAGLRPVPEMDTESETRQWMRAQLQELSEDVDVLESLDDERAVAALFAATALS